MKIFITRQQILAQHASDEHSKKKERKQTKQQQQQQRTAATTKKGGDWKQTTYGTLTLLRLKREVHSHSFRLATRACRNGDKGCEARTRCHL